MLVIAPRHPERFAEVERLCQQEGLLTVRRTELPIDAEPRADAVVLDTIGELAEVYQIATVVFVGGSLVPAGGHNILEPALFGKPIAFGPYMENFAEIVEAFLANDAAIQVRSERDLDDVIVALMGDPVRRARLGAAARALIEANRGAKDKTMAVITSLVPPSGSANEAASSAHSVWSIERAQRALRPCNPASSRMVRPSSSPCAPARSARHQCRQSRRGRQRQDARRCGFGEAALRRRRTAFRY